MAAAHVREACGIPGTRARTAYLCRDKPAMKEVLRAAGVPCAASTGARQRRRGPRVRRAVGYPLILKPRDGAGASGTHRVDDAERARRRASLARGGRPRRSDRRRGVHRGPRGLLRHDHASTARSAHDFVSHYYPNVLEAMRTRWISPQFIATNRIDAGPATTRSRRWASGSSSALGIETSATHMEWFFGPKGLRFSEIGCRPPGVRAWDLYTVGNDIDLYREWANAVVHGQRRAAAVAPLRRRHHRAAPRPRRPHRRLRRASTRCSTLRRVDHRRAPPAAGHARPSRSRPATWPTPGSACATRTTTRCAACSTPSGAQSRSAPHDGRPTRPPSCGSACRRRSRRSTSSSVAATR